MPDTLTEDLRRLIAEQQVLVVVGSGVSIAATNNAAAASWDGLLRLGVARCGELYPREFDAKRQARLLVGPVELSGPRWPMRRALKREISFACFHERARV